MNINRRWLSVGGDLFILQGTWTLWALGIFFILNLVVHFFTGHLVDADSNFLITGLSSATGYLLVIGIITTTEGVKTFARVGVTRKEYFKGNLLSTLALATALVTALVPLHFALGAVLQNYDAQAFFSVRILIEGVLQAIQFYLFGWLVILGFKRYGALGGIITIAVLSAVMGIYQSVWNFEGALSEINFFLWVVNLEILQVSFAVAALLSVLLILITLWFIHKLTAELEIKV